MDIELVDSLPPNRGKFLKITIKTLVIFFLSIGIISKIILMLEDDPIDFRAYWLRMLVELTKTCDAFSSSPLYIVIAEQFVIILIVVSFGLHRRRHPHPVDEHDINISESPPTMTPPSAMSTFKNDKKIFADEYDKEEDTSTMDATWKAISGGGKENIKPKKEQVVMKKSETWGGVRRPRRGAAMDRIDSEELFSPKSSYRAWKNLRKAETFNDSVSIIRRGGLRRDSLSSMEEFNNKVEAFIKKTKDNMRLQRQESALRVFDDMINNI